MHTMFKSIIKVNNNLGLIFVVWAIILVDIIVFASVKYATFSH